MKVSDYELELKTNPKTSYWDEEELVDALEYALIAGIDPKIESYVKKELTIFSPPIKSVKRSIGFGGYLSRDCYSLDVSGTSSISFGAHGTPFHLALTLESLQELGAIDQSVNFLELLPKIATSTFIDKPGSGSYASTYFAEAIGESKRWKYREGQIGAYRIIKIFHCDDGRTDAMSFCYGYDKNLNFRPLLPRGIRDTSYDAEVDEDEVSTILMRDTFCGLNICLERWIQRNIRPNFYLKARQDGAQTRLSVLDEEIQSLFYARDLNPTTTGRKKPLLHWVKAHHRRMKSGVEVDISEYLRGDTKFNLLGMDLEIISPVKSKGRTQKKGFGDKRRIS
jgi:hypothetical protein